MIFSENISLKQQNTFDIDVTCKLFCTIQSQQDISDLIHSDEFKNNKNLILGGGSNLLFTKDFNGLVIKNNITGKEIMSETNDLKTVKIGAGENWHQFVLWSIEKGLSGIENMALIPGNVGASPMQNIGAYGAEAKDVIENVWAINIENGEELIFSNSDCNFQYRNSIFKNELKEKVIITHVSFNLSKTPNNNTKYGAIKEEIQNLGLEISTESICKAVINIRERKLPNPAEIGNSGSFFKNPIISTTQFEEIQKQLTRIVGYKVSETETKVAAGWLIEQCGWKGYRKGDAGVHKNQALVLVNYGNAKGEEIISLSKEIQHSVKEKFEIEIHPEVNIIG
jgi:UDP-N-acetylmuramate dehydrogenase